MKDAVTLPSQQRAADLVLHTLATEFPRLLDREGLLGSETLRRRFEEDGGFEQAEMPARAAEAVSKLVAEKAVSEVLVPHHYAEGAELLEQGIIAVSIDLRSMREARLSSGIENTEQPPNQESILAEIVQRSRDWIIDHLDGTRPPLVITSACIVHGSNEFDILVNVSYRHPYNLLLFTREVLQAVDHVACTQTMLVAKSVGFPNL